MGHIDTRTHARTHAPAQEHLFLLRVELVPRVGVGLELADALELLGLEPLLEVVDDHGGRHGLVVRLLVVDGMGGSELRLGLLSPPHPTQHTHKRASRTEMMEGLTKMAWLGCATK